MLRNSEKSVTFATLFVGFLKFVLFYYETSN